MKTFCLVTCEGSTGRWHFYEKDENGTSTELFWGKLPEDAIRGTFSPSRGEEILEEIEEQIQTELGFLPDYTIL